MIYLDNAATSWPKPPGVGDAVKWAVDRLGGSPGRGLHQMAADAAAVVWEARQLLARLFRAEGPERIVLTPGATIALNVALKGTLRPGDHVVTSALEHNSLIRPLATLRQKGVEVTVVEPCPDGRVRPDDIAAALRRNTRLIALTHASNVFGTIQPLREVGELAADRGIIFLVDAAQTAGIHQLDVRAEGISVLAFSGHKGLLGPQGTGGLYVREGTEVEPLVEGGTGFMSESDRQPPGMPERLEAGTLNLPGISGLRAGLEFIGRVGIETLAERQCSLADAIAEGLRKLPRVRVHRFEAEHSPVVSFVAEGIDPNDLAGVLDRGYSIAVRGGLHCAPWAHRWLGTLPSGSVRVSPGYFNTLEDVEALLMALRQVLGEG